MLRKEGSLEYSSSCSIIIGGFDCPPKPYVTIMSRGLFSRELSIDYVLLSKYGTIAP
jgi:hypothetical protein